MLKSPHARPERRKLVRAWIWFWYNDLTRLLLVLSGGHLALTGPLLWLLGLREEALRTGVIAAYVVVVVWALLDNDYTNLHRIGLDTQRRPLKQPRGLQAPGQSTPRAP
ncbi:hypothetical protein D3C71_19520 [compost metagenome]